jgi:Xaa-Pro aminopeptidase
MSNNNGLSRIKKAQQLMMERKIDTFLCLEPESIHYLTGAIPDAFFLTRARNFICSFLFVPQRGEPEVYVLSMDVKRAKQQAWIRRVKPFSIPPHGDASVKIIEITKNRGFQRATIGVEKKFLTAFQFERFQQTLPQVTFLDASDLIPELAVSKSSIEVQYIERAINIAFLGMKAALGSVKEGISELEIAAEADMVMKKNGSQRNSLTTLVASGTERNLLSHPCATEKKIEKDDLIVIDIGAVYKGYCSDLCRTAIYGKPTAKQKKVFQAVLEAQNAGFGAAKPGVAAGRVAASIRDVFRKYELDKFAPEMRGHGIGLQLWQYPRICADNPSIIPHNTALTLLETAPFVRGVGHIRLEDTALVTSEGSRILGDQSVPRELICL